MDKNKMLLELGHTDGRGQITVVRGSKKRKESVDCLEKMEEGTKFRKRDRKRMEVNKEKAPGRLE